MTNGERTNFNKQLINHTFILDRVGLLNSLNNNLPIKNQLEELYENKKDIFDDLTDKYSDLQKDIKEVIKRSSINLDNLNEIMNDSPLIDLIKNVDQNIFNVLYNKSKRIWWSPVEKPRYDIMKIQNRCICNHKIVENIILYHKDYNNGKKLNLIIGNECINHLEMEKMTNDQCSRCDIVGENKGIFNGINSLVDKNKLKKYTKCEKLNQRGLNDNVISDNEYLIINEKIKRNNKLRFHSYEAIVNYCDIKNKMCKYYCPQSIESDNDIYDPEDIIKDPNITFVNDEITEKILIEYAYYYLKNGESNYKPLNNNIPFMDIINYGDYSDRVVTFIPDFRMQKNGKYEVKNIKIDEYGFVNYSWDKLEDYQSFTCNKCNKTFIKNNGYDKKCLCCYYNDKTRNNHQEIMLYTGDTKKMIKCENCNSDFEYNMYKRCPLLIDDFVIKCYLC